MKLVKQYLNEKFTEDSDPVHDLEVGGIDLKKYHEDNVKPAIKEWFKYLVSFRGKNITFTDINGKKLTFILKSVLIKKDKDINTDVFRNIIFVESYQKSYQVDINKKIFVEE